MHYHLIGICGTAMASLAGLLRAKGHRVTGSDEHVYPPMSTMLADLGIPVLRGYAPEHLDPAPDLVVVGNAIPRGNAEVEYVLDARIPYTSAAATIKEECIRGRTSVVVAGTHGKTTTTSLVAWALERASLDPSFLIGGIAENFGSSFRWTGGDLFCIEGDEYDTAYFDKGPKLMHYLPDTAILNNVEFDHADIYRDFDAVKLAFRRFVNLVPRRGALVAGWDSPAVRELAPRAFCRVESFGVEEGARWRAERRAVGADGMRFRVTTDGVAFGEYRTPIVGDFNMRNCLATIVAAETLGADREAVRDALATFESVKRRMELRGEARGVRIVDDFAHHPTAVRETLAAIREKYPDGRLVAVYEPRSLTSRQRVFQQEYERSFDAADLTVVARLYEPERYAPEERLDPDELIAAINGRGREAHYVATAGEIVEFLVPRLEPGDTVVVMSNGGFDAIHDKLLAALGAAVCERGDGHDVEPAGLVARHRLVRDRRHRVRLLTRRLPMTADRYAEVAVPLNVRQTYTYRLPAVLAERATPGCRVLVPVRNKIVTGYVVAIHDAPGEGLDPAAIKDVEQLVDEEPVVTAEILRLTQWIADYYYAPWGECLKSALPAGLTASSEAYLTVTDAGRAALAAAGERRAATAILQALARVCEAGTLRARDAGEGATPARANALARELERKGWVRVEQRVGEQRVQPKRQNVVRLVAAPVGLAAEGGRETEAQQRAVAELEARGGSAPFSALVAAAGVSPSVVRTLERRGRVEVVAEEVRRDPLEHVRIPEAEMFEPTERQREALDAILGAVDAGTYCAFLLHGVTGSGKTEVYIRAMRAAVERGRSALMLVPEINLTPIFSRCLASHFGDAFAILHSSLSDGERLDEWRRIRRGEARVVIGTRSAVFAPLQNLGVVVVDEEHETSYKQDATPRYSGRDTAVYRAREAGAIVILGSATPSLETFHNAHNGKYTYIRLDTRVGGRPLADVEVVDMREVFTRFGKQQTFSPELLDAIRATSARGEQSIVLLNRRGFSSFLLCRSCGYAIRCPNCDVTLTYHKAQSRLVCHYCNHQASVPQQCPECSGPFIFYVGEGTEQLEARLREEFPDLRIARLDRDTAQRRGAYERIIMEFAGGDLDLLVGTQMIAKGHDFPNVTLVGVVSVDAGLGLPDFRSAERAFQLLTQVAGRAGRGDAAGRVLIQTYHPEHYAIAHARGQDYEGFYEREIAFRRSMNYPPFTTLINCLVQEEDVAKARATASELARALAAAASGRQLRVLGPAPAPLARLKNKHRWQVLIKARARADARDALDLALAHLAEAKADARTISIEVDPVSLM